MAQAPTLQRLHLGQELRRLREQAGLSADQAAAELECDRSKVSRIELGRQGITLGEVKLLLTLYGVGEREGARIVEVARDAKKRVSSEPVPEWIRTYVSAEREAESIQKFEVELVPGLLQTEAYTRAVTLAADPTRKKEDVERLVGIRRERQRRLHGERPPRLHVVMNEAVIRRLVGGSSVLRDQLERLVELAALPTVSLQLLPFDVGAHAAMGTSFSVLALPAPQSAQVVYMEDIWSGTYVSRPEEITAYTDCFERLCTSALDERATVSMIKKAAGELR